MTKIQEETAAMQVAAEVLAALKSETEAEKEACKIAKSLANTLIPAFERVRATAQEELESPGGLSDLISDNYHDLLSGLEATWSVGFSVLFEDDNELSENWLNGIRQGSKIHTLSRIASGIEPSGYPEPPAATEGGGGGKTKWPPLPC